MTSSVTTTIPKPPAPFDYDGVPAETAKALRAQAARIRTLVKNTTAIIIQVGNDLIAVKQTIDHGKFLDWIEAECGFSVRTAENYIRAAEFAEGKNATVAILNPATVYRLAAKSTPVEIVNAVIGRAEKGEIVSDRDVVAALELVRAQRRQVAAAAKRTERAPSKRTEAKWEKRRQAQKQMDDMAAQARREAIAGLIEAIGLNNARIVVDTLQGCEVFEKLAELKRACQDPAGDIQE